VLTHGQRLVTRLLGISRLVGREKITKKTLTANWNLAIMITQVADHKTPVKVRGMGGAQ